MGMGLERAELVFARFWRKGALLKAVAIDTIETETKAGSFLALPQMNSGIAIWPSAPYRTLPCALMA